MRSMLAALALGLVGCLPCDDPAGFPTTDLILTDTLDTGDESTVEDTAAPVNTRPVAEIQRPMDDYELLVPAMGNGIPFGELELRGVGTDRQDGALVDGQLQWTTDNDIQTPILGQGPQVDAIFYVEQCGTTVHVVTLTVTDAGGLQGTDEVEVTVRHICPG